MTKKKILIADDEPDFLTIVSDYLERQGFQIEVALDGEACLKQASSFNPDLILLDIHMPKKDGWEVCRALRKHPSTQSIPVILLTALLQDTLQEQAREVGAKGIFTKSGDLKNVVKFIREQVA